MKKILYGVMRNDKLLYFASEEGSNNYIRYKWTTQIENAREFTSLDFMFTKLPNALPLYNPFSALKRIQVRSTRDVESAIEIHYKHYLVAKHKIATARELHRQNIEEIRAMFPKPVRPFRSPLPQYRFFYMDPNAATPIGFADEDEANEYYGHPRGSHILQKYQFKGSFRGK